MLNDLLTVERFVAAACLILVYDCPHIKGVFVGGRGSNRGERERWMGEVKGMGEGSRGRQ